MRKILDLANSLLVESTTVVEHELVKPFADSPLHEMSVDDLRAKLLEARSGQHWLKQYSNEEIAHREFVHEATSILEFKIAHKKVSPQGNIKSITTVADEPKTEEKKPKIDAKKSVLNRASKLTSETIIDESKPDYTADQIVIHQPGHRLHGKPARIFHRNSNGSVNAQVTHSSKKGDVTNFTLMPGQFKQASEVKESVELDEAVAKYGDYSHKEVKVGDAVGVMHPGSTFSTYDRPGKTGAVTKVNGHGHVHVNHEDGTTSVFDKSGKQKDGSKYHTPYLVPAESHKNVVAKIQHQHNVNASHAAIHEILANHRTGSGRAVEFDAEAAAKLHDHINTLTKK